MKFKQIKQTLSFPLLILLSYLLVGPLRAEPPDLAGGYRFKYYAVTHDGAPETYGGSGVIYISPEHFGFDTHPQLRDSPYLKQLEDRVDECALKRNGARFCMANLPAPGVRAAFPLMHRALKLSRAWIKEDSISIPYISD